MTKRIIVLGTVLLLAFLLPGCAGTGPVGPPGPEGPPGPAGPPAPATVATGPLLPETCSICHSDAGSNHQASYNQLYQEGVITVSNLAYRYAAPSTHILTFTMAKDGAPYDANDAEQMRFYFVPWTGSAFQFEPAAERLALTGDITCDSAGRCTSTLDGGDDPAYATNFRNVDGLIVAYGRDETQGRLPARVQLSKYPIAAILETGGGVDYISAANNDGCEKCHTDPYLKHGYILGQLDGDPETDFYTCKVCHLDNGEGGHYEWQLLVNDPAKAVEWLGSDEDTSIFTAEELDQLAYKTSLKNDVHMSHAMEFPYPQSMSSCVTCHEGKLDRILTEEFFTVETCKSCHPMNGSEEAGTVEVALATIIPPDLHGSMDLATTDCTSCHKEDGAASAFSEIHSGYDTMIYAAPDLEYGDAITISIDEASYSDGKITVKFSAAEDPDVEGVDVADIVPTVMVGMYGWDTKDFIIGPHERLVDDNNDGEISRSSGDERALEYEVGAEHPRASTVSAGGGSWEVLLDMTTWVGYINDGTVRRLEIAVMPALEVDEGEMIALDAPSRTFDLTANDFDDGFYGEIVKLEGCENCHDALATNYHSPDRGGSIVVCRMCHITKSGGSHLEMQSRSIDSYVHAIHSGQAFDIGDIDFSDPVAALEYEHHIHFPYPTHGITNCESCHNTGTYEVPDQAASLPGLLSASDTVEGWDRNIGDVPVYITGPASRACGACHKAELINEDAAGELAILQQHIKQGGYLVEGGEDSSATLLEVIDSIMAFFE